MIKQTILIENPCRLSTKHQQLVLKRDDGEMTTIPFEDIGLILLDNPRISLTQNVLTKVAEFGVVAVHCNGQHLPSGLTLPLNGHTQQNLRYRYQLNAKLPLLKQLWRRTISAKLYNQAALLTQYGLQANLLFEYAKQVKSGDPENLEGLGARYYWQTLLGKAHGWQRDREGPVPNNLLNYGYAILRASVARSLIASGLLLTLGYHHNNQYNPYCLADDLMEPFRPYVDWIALELYRDEPDLVELRTEHKAALLKVLQVDAIHPEYTRPLELSIRHTAASLAQCYLGEKRQLNFPQIPKKNKGVQTEFQPD